MLQRATTCLESGGRLLRGSKRSIRSRRMLHSSFWHHAAGDLDLPAWWSNVIRALDPPKLDSRTNQNSDDWGITFCPGQESMFLDFLYPTQTLALMRRISSRSKTWDSGTPLLSHRPRTRHFSTKSERPETGASDMHRNELEQQDNQRIGEGKENGEPEFLDDVEQEYDDSDFSPMFLPPSDEANESRSKDVESVLDTDEHIDGSFSVGADALEATSEPENLDEGSFSDGDDALSALAAESDKHHALKQSERARLEDGINDISSIEDFTHEEIEHQSPLLDRSPSQALEELQEILSGPEGRVRPGLIRGLYNLVPEEDRTPPLIADVLHHVSNESPFGTSLAQFSIGLFDALGVDQRNVSSYKAAVIAHLALGNLGKAALLHDQARNRFALGDYGSSNLLAHAIRRKRWDIAIAVSKSARRLANPKYERLLWSRIAEDPHLPTYATSFLVYLRSVRWLSDKISPSQDKPTYEFAVPFMNRALWLSAHKTVTEEEQAQLWRFVMRMKQEGILQEKHWAITVLELMNNRVLRRLKVMPEITRRSYRNYALTFEQGGNVRRPARSVLYGMIVRLSKHQQLSHGTQISISEVVELWRRFYGELETNVLTMLMRTYSRLGQDSQVIEHFESYLKVNGGRLLEIAHFWPMIHVYARRADVGNAQRQFDRISTEFKLYPDIHCWNILLTAYCRQDDLEGASRLFNELLKSKLIPDPHSFSSILKLMAQRGDVDGVRHMLGVASDTNKNALRSTWVIGTLVSALINADSMESAELAVEEIYERHQRGEIEGSMTPILNNLLVAYARKRDIASTRRLYKHMIAREIRPDALTYAAFMQALALVHQTQAAWKILRTVVPDQNVSEIGMHYAICMAGFIMQEEYHLVELVDLRRSRRGIPDTLSVRLARELSKAKQGARDQKLMVPEDYANRRLPSAEKLLNLYLRDGDTGSLIATEPQLGLEETSLDRAGQSYFDILMTAYGDKGSHHLVQKLIDRYREIYQADAGNSQDKEAPPLRMIVALMHAHYQAGRYEEVESCWKMAVEQANRQARLIRPLESAGTQNSDVQADEVGPARRRILARPLGIYIRALQEQLRHKTVHSVVDSVLRSGYELDNQSWNIYIQNLARSGRISDAYSICEQYLMRDWPGWKKFARPTNRKTARGWHHLDVTPVTMPTELVLPQYKTMVILAAALQYVRKTDAIGSRTTGEDLVSEATLRSRAPSVVAAVETMPYVEDDLQTQFLSAN